MPSAASSQVVGEGFHPKAGMPHAEVYALRGAGMVLMSPSTSIRGSSLCTLFFSSQRTH